MKLKMNKFVELSESAEYTRGRWDKELYKVFIETLAENFIPMRADKTQEIVFEIYQMVNSVSGLWEFMYYAMGHKDYVRKANSDIEKILKANDSEICDLNNSKYILLRPCFFMTYPGKN